MFTGLFSKLRANNLVIAEENYVTLLKLKNGYWKLIFSPPKESPLILEGTPERLLKFINTISKIEYPNRIVEKLNENLETVEIDL